MSKGKLTITGVITDRMPWDFPKPRDHVAWNIPDYGTGFGHVIGRDNSWEYVSTGDGGPILRFSNQHMLKISEDTYNQVKQLKGWQTASSVTLVRHRTSQALQIMLPDAARVFVYNADIADITDTGWITEAEDEAGNIHRLPDAADTALDALRRGAIALAGYKMKMADPFDVISDRAHHV